tara:strand:+ start:1155 stop:2060 length:906 start_codon:yes stop_codon:yes gene_type:complete
MPVIFVTSSKKEVGKTTVLSGISYESIKRGLKTFVGEFNGDQIVEHSNFYNLMDSKEIKCEFTNSDLALIEINNTSIDSIKRLSSKYDAKIILVEESHNSIKEASKALSDRLIGIFINGVLRYQKNELIQNYSKEKLNILGYLDQTRSLLALSSDELIESLNPTKVISLENSNKLIENYLIGGFVLDWGPEFFSKFTNTALIVRGDRPDVQLSAIQAGNLNVIIATNNETPVEYVLHEANKYKIPIMVVDKSTENIIDQISENLEKVKFNHPDKIINANEILSNSLNFDKLFEILSTPITT